MNLSALLQTASGQLLLLSVAVFAILAVLILPSYFLSIRPKRGTVEWMAYIDRPKLSALSAQRLQWNDIVWFLLSGFGAAMLRLSAYLLKYVRRDWLSVLTQRVETLLLRHVLPCAILAVLMYLLLRSMFDNTMPAVCGAILCGMMQLNDYVPVILLVLSLNFLWRYAAADKDMPLTRHCLLMLFAALFFGVAILRFWAMVWLAPIYVAAYFYAQIYRWRSTTLPNRGVALAISLLLVFFMTVGAIGCTWLYYCRRYAMMDQILNLQRFCELFAEKARSRIHALLPYMDPLSSIYAEDAILFIIGMISFLPILHGIFCRRDSRCIVLLAIAPFFFAAWLCGGLYLLVPMLTLALTWVCNIFFEREYPQITVGFTALTAIAFLAEFYI